jgi:dTDP-glucose 4,6-dehydratase
MTKYFITGGTGFIGSNIVEKILSFNNNDTIIVYDLNINKNIIKNNRIEYRCGDILDTEYLNNSLKNIDVVIHCAAICGINSVCNNSLKTNKINFNGTENVLECCKNNNVNKIILFSTSEIYGKYCIGYTEVNEINIIPVSINKRSIYQIGKLLCETYGYLYSDSYNMNISIIRPFNIYGPRQIGDGAIKKFIINSLKNEPIIINGDGSNIRSWCYIDDLVNSVISVIDKTKNFNIYNIGNSGNIITIKSLAEQIINLTNSSSKIIYTDKLNDDVILRFPNTEKASKELNYEAKTSLIDGLIKTIDYYKKNL